MQTKHVLIIFFLKNMTFKQCFKIKSFIVDVNNCLNGIFPWFDTLNRKISPGSRLIDSFSSHFLFYQANCKDKESKTIWLLSFLMLASKITLPLQSLMSILSPIQPRRHFIMLSMSPWPKQNYLWSDVGLVRLFKSLISLSLPMLFMWLKGYLIQPSILTNYNQLLS